MSGKKRISTNVDFSVKKVEKTSLNIKINSELDIKLKKARAYSRTNGAQFNVSKHVEAFLENLISSYETGMKVNLDDVDMEGNVDKKVEN